jgi:hypothetical protein
MLKTLTRKLLVTGVALLSGATVAGITLAIISVKGAKGAPE